MVIRGSLIFLFIRSKYLIMTRSAPASAGGKSRQFTILKLDTVFNFYKPKPPLSKLIDNLWLFEGDAEHKIERILPTGTLELAINLRENDLGFYDPARAENRTHFSGAVVSGAHSQGFAPVPTDKVLIIGAHFKPGGAFPFLGLPANELADAHVDLDALWGSAANRLRERLCEARSSAERFQLLEEALLKRLSRRGTERHYAVSAALKMFAKHQGAPTVREASKYLGLSQRRFIEVFKAEVGLTPKLFSRIQRFQHTRAFIDRNPAPDWVALALDLGYFDQSHFIREFSEFSGLSPTDYLNRHQSFPAQDRHAEGRELPRF